MMAVVTGGSGSGKSEYAESLATELYRQQEKKNGLIYIATMIPFDQECEKRVVRHRRMRAKKSFYTIEQYINLEKLEIPKGATVLLECMSNWLANERYQQGGAGKNCVQAVLSGISHLKRQAEHLIIVTNEVFSDGMTLDSETMFYIEQLGKINQWMAEKAQIAVEVVYSIPIFYKGGIFFNS